METVEEVPEEPTGTAAEHRKLTTQCSKKECNKLEIGKGWLKIFCRTWVVELFFVPHFLNVMVSCIASRWFLLPQFALICQEEAAKDSHEQWLKLWNPGIGPMWGSRFSITKWTCALWLDESTVNVSMDAKFVWTYLIFGWKAANP